MPGPELLVLARHARPVVDPGAPAASWPLSEDGVEAARRMGEAWRDLGLVAVVSSTERKARETGALAAAVLDITFQTGHDLHEHERPYVADAAAFHAGMQAFFADPKAWGPAERRFTAAVDRLVSAYRGERLAVVAHGTVLSLHLAARYRLDAWRTWSRLGLPAYAVVEVRTKTVVDLVTDL